MAVQISPQQKSSFMFVRSRRIMGSASHYIIWWEQFGWFALILLYLYALIIFKVRSQKVPYLTMVKNPLQ